MKKGKILNRAMNDAICAMGHTDVLIVSDAGYNVPAEGVICVDLAITQDLPSVLEIVKLLTTDFIYERCIVAEEQKKYNPVFHQQLVEHLDRCEIETVPHTDIIGQWRDAAKVIIRTGGLEPWGNIVFTSGIDAPAYFAKEGVITPDYYESRASYEETE